VPEHGYTHKPDASLQPEHYLNKENPMNTQSIYKSPAGKREIMARYDAVLARWPVPYETFNLPTRHGDTFLIASGEKSAPPLVLLHGSASNAVSWVGDVPEYSQHFRVVAVDLPGEPGKSAENRPAWDGTGFAEWLEDVLDGLEIQKTAMLGISQGGWTALKFATSQPERVTRLVLLAPGGVMPVRQSFILKAVLFSMLGHWGTERINRIVLGKRPIHPEAVEFMEAIYTHFKVRVGKEYLFSDDELKRLNMPTLLIGGAEDALFPMDGVVARMQKFVPLLKAVLIPDMGHALVNLSGQITPFLTT
jgi:pimeloyl-ACP methyl ester carboxylesterase